MDNRDAPRREHSHNLVHRHREQLIGNQQIDQVVDVGQRSPIEHLGRNASVPSPLPDVFAEFFDLPATDYGTSFLEPRV